MGAAYPDVAYGMEGDTPSWLALIPNGLGDPEHPDWGGWGGRYELHRPEVSVTHPLYIHRGGVPINKKRVRIWTNAMDEYTPPVRGQKTEAPFTRAKNHSTTSKPHSGDGGMTSKTISLAHELDDEVLPGD